jgi:hypothetical protein
MVRRLRPFRRAAEVEDKVWMALDEVIPPAVRGHLRNARREVLLAVRAMLDYAIARAETPAEPRRPRHVRVR